MYVLQLQKVLLLKKLKDYCIVYIIVMDTVSGCVGGIDKEQLFSPSLLRLWRTGADNYLYSSSEDGDVDVCPIMIHVLLE